MRLIGPARPSPAWVGRNAREVHEVGWADPVPTPMQREREAQGAIALSFELSLRFSRGAGVFI